MTGHVPTIGYPGKRALDIIASGAGLILLSPIMLIGATLVRVAMGRPVLFRQIRPGRDERPFLLFKFRTMSDTKDSNGEYLSDEMRLTPMGRLLRKTSVDELPQLFNVLRGDMSLVGPRPLLMRYLPYYRPDERLRFRVRPGITGLAQVCGRNELQWDDRIRADVEYVEHCSFALDLRILWRTVVAVSTQKGLQVNGTMATEYFDVERQRAGATDYVARSKRTFLAEL